MVVSRTPRARAIRAQLWPITGSARSRRQDLPASSLTRLHRVAGYGQDGSGGAAGGASAAARGQVADRGWGRAGGSGDADVGAAVLSQAADVHASGTGTAGRVRPVGCGWA